MNKCYFIFIYYFLFPYGQIDVKEWKYICEEVI